MKAGWMKSRLPSTEYFRRRFAMARYKALEIDCKIPEELQWVIEE